MSYTKTTWRNNQSPAINADNLNHIEQGIYDAHDGLASANNNMELMDNRLQAEIDDANSDISTLESNLAAETSARTQQDSVLSARMDTFTQLPSGSTSGDAELIDIRVGADGTTYSTAGDAVRGQVSDLKSDLDGVQNVTAFVPSLTWEQGGLSDGADSTSNIRIRTKFIAFTKGTEVKFSVLSGYKYAVNFYNASKTWLTEKYWLTADTAFYANSDGYLRVVLGHSNNAGITPSDSSNMVVTVTKPITNDIFAMQSDQKVYQQTNVTDADATASLLWQQGSLSSGVNSDAPDRIRTASYIFVGDINTLKISVSDGYQVAVNKYNAD